MKSLLSRHQCGMKAHQQEGAMHRHFSKHIAMPRGSHILQSGIRGTSVSVT